MENKAILRRATAENGVIEGIPAADPRITAFKGIPYGLDAYGSKMPEWTPHTAEIPHFMLFPDKAGMDKSNKYEPAKFVLEFWDDIIESLKFKR